MADVKLNYLIVSEQVITDREDKVSIINIFQKVLASAVPAIHTSLFIVMNTYGEPGKYKATIDIVSPVDGKIIASASDEIEIRKEGGNNLVARFVNIVFPDFGKYLLKGSVEGIGPLTNPDLHYVLVEKSEA
jgi:hypothetical protein